MFAPVGTQREQSEPSADRAQSELVGTVLLVAVAVIAVSTVSTFVLGSYLNDVAQADEGPRIEIMGSITTDRIQLIHAAGDSRDVDDLTVVIRNGSERRIDFASGSPTGDTFDVGETWTYGSVTFSDGESVRVLLIDGQSNTVLFDGKKIAREAK